LTIIEWDTVKNWVYDWLCMVNNAFDTAMNALTVSPFNSSISAINTALTAVEGVALVLVSLFFAMQLCNEAMLLKIQSYEQVFKVFFKFILAKVIVQNARGLMGIIYNSFNSVASGLIEDSYGFLSEFTTSDILPEPDEAGFLGLNYLVKYLEVMPTFLILMGACWVINLILIGRIFEIVVYTAVSPIPLATFAAEGWHDSAKAFIKSYAAVCLQGLVVVLMFYSFSQVIDLMGGSDKVGITIVALSLALGVAKSGQWARQAIGCA
jgi:hypothetical protein